MNRKQLTQEEKDAEWAYAMEHGNFEDDDSYEFTDESDDVDPDGELGRIAWIERTKKDIANAKPHENPFWNCAVCGNQCIGTSFIALGEKKELGSPAANVHLFECSDKFRRDWGLTWSWEQSVGVPKPGFDIDGEPLNKAQPPAVEVADVSLSQ